MLVYFWGPAFYLVHLHPWPDRPLVLSEWPNGCPTAQHRTGAHSMWMNCPLWGPEGRLQAPALMSSMYRWVSVSLVPQVKTPRAITVPFFIPQSQQLYTLNSSQGLISPHSLLRPAKPFRKATAITHPLVSRSHSPFSDLKLTSIARCASLPKLPQIPRASTLSSVITHYSSPRCDDSIHNKS